MTKTITVEGDITAVDTATTLATQGSVAGPALTIPAGSKNIKKMVVAIGTSVGGAGSATFLVRLGGNGVQKGEQAIVVAAAGYTAAQAGSDQGPNTMGPLVFENLDVEVAPGNTIRVQGEMMGTDLGTVHMGVTLFFA